MNWKRGIFRLWIAASAVWVLASGFVLDYHIGVHNYYRLTKGVHIISEQLATNTPRVVPETGEVIPVDEMKRHLSVLSPEKERIGKELLGMSGIVFGLPVLAVLLLLAAGWVARGFRGAKA